jgi:hypothetical protein
LPDENYVATQGVSKRANCPLYLAIKAEVLAIGAAVEKCIERDFYISDLWQILMKIYSHSKYDHTVVKGSGGLYDPYTPYSYLLREINSDFEDLTERAVQRSVESNTSAPQNAAPTTTGAKLVQMWCLSIWELMSESNRVNPAHLDKIVERYLRFMFALGGQTTEILYTSGQGVAHLYAWRDCLFEEFEDCTKSPTTEHIKVLHRVFGNLDWGKPFISDGYDWLKAQLHPSFFP